MIEIEPTIHEIILQSVENMQTASFKQLNPSTTTLKILKSRSTMWADIGKELAKYSMIKKLSIVDCQATDGLLEGVATMKSLVQLYLDNNLLTDEGISKLITLTSLKKLSLLGNFAITGRSISKILVRIRNLDVLNVLLPEKTNLVVWNQTPPDRSLDIITHSLNHINQLTLFNCALKPATGINIALNMKKLTILRLSHNQIGDEAGETIAIHLANLTQLDLQKNNIGDNTAVQIGRRLSHLNSLNLNYNKIGMHGIISLVRNLSHINKIHLKFNHPELIGVYEMGSKMANVYLLGVDSAMGLKERVLKIMLPRKDQLVIY